MGKKNKPLSQAEIWDDTALLESWDEALEEYKLYHSIHARGERIEDVLRSAEAADLESTEKKDSISAARDHNDGTKSDDLEDGELEDEAPKQKIDSVAAIRQPHATTDESLLAQQPASVEASAQSTGVADIPNPVLAGVQDEALKNLMMSWYYAGYYTGLYEGQQKVVQKEASSSLNSK